ncbi:hypothetical protein GTW78_17410, partial [Streptomyces sp. SID4948]|nr:hypothetical protein [Streptomyces sp. SID4948]
VAQPWSDGAGHGGRAAGAAKTGATTGTATGATGASRSAAAGGSSGSSFPTQPLLVRADTAPGWPSHCHGVIAVRAADRDDPRRIVPGGTCDELPVWAPDRATFAFTRAGASSTAVWVANADGSDPHEVAPISGGKVSWSPDGTRLAVTRVTGGVSRIYTVSVSDGSAQPVTSGTEDVKDPAWSPDGTRLAVCIQAAPGLWQINLVKLADPGAAPVRITHGAARATTPAWSPDGSRLAYTYGKPLVGDQGDIRVVGADGTGDRPLAASGDEEMDPTWSPDGAWVAYVRGPVGTPAVWAVRADGTGARKLTTGSLPEGHPSWS